jgi:hypothetical protein
MSLSRVVLAPPERKELERRARSRSLAVELVRRAKVILMLAAGRSYREICKRLGCTDRYISFSKERFKQERLIGLEFALPGSRVPPSHGSDRSSHFGIDPTRTNRRLDPLEQLSACQGGGGESVDRQSSVAPIWTPTPPFAQLHGQ